jgi:hypothetical protein
MSDDTSARLALPLLAAGQAQKEMTVNEALTRLDIAVQASVVAGGLDQPPVAPKAGQCWIVGEAPGGDWSGRAGMLAGWTRDGWRFIAPGEGMAVWAEVDGTSWRRVGGVWKAGEIRGSRMVLDGVQVVGAQQAAILAPNGGDIVDAEARDTIAAILAALHSHGLIAV